MITYTSRIPSSVFTRWHTSKPFIFGIMTSRKTRRGFSLRMISSASSPFSAVRISTPSSSSSSSVCSISRRMWASSSTIRMQGMRNLPKKTRRGMRKRQVTPAHSALRSVTLDHHQREIVGGRRLTDKGLDCADDGLQNFAGAGGGIGRERGLQALFAKHLTVGGARFGHPVRVQEQQVSRGQIYRALLQRNEGKRAHHKTPRVQLLTHARSGMQPEGVIVSAARVRQLTATRIQGGIEGAQ